MCPALGLGVLSVLGQCAHRCECGCDLLVQLLTICHDDERPVAPETPQDLLGKHDHREALPAPLGMPEHAKTALVLLQALDGLDGTVHPEDLMVFRDNLPQAATSILEEEEVLNQIEETARLARSS